MLKIGLLGTRGKMGKVLAETISRSPLFQAASSCEVADVIIDFSHPLATENYLKNDPSKPLVIGTTGHSQAQLQLIEDSAQKIPILLASNFSLGMALCLKIAAFLGQELRGKAFIDIVETHHIHKKDAPSGTALSLKKAINPTDSCSPSNPRTKEDIVIHSIRSGEVLGEHTIRFECGQETLTLSHTIHSRTVFAEGALYAAKILKDKPAGFYTLQDL